MNETSLTMLRKPANYRQARDHVFQSEGSLDWFCRKWRQQLVDNGALVRIKGQWYVHEQRFDTFVLQQGEREARQHASAAA